MQTINAPKSLKDTAIPLFSTETAKHGEYFLTSDPTKRIRLNFSEDDKGEVKALASSLSDRMVRSLGG